MAFCTKCGNEIKDGTKFCMSCGTEVAPNSTSETPSGNSAVSEENAENISSKKKKQKKTAFIIVAATILFLLIVGIFGSSDESGGGDKAGSDVVVSDDVGNGENDRDISNKPENKLVKEDKSLPNGAYFDLSKEDIVSQFEKETGLTMYESQIIDGSTEEHDYKDYIYTDKQCVSFMIKQVDNKICAIICDIDPVAVGVIYDLDASMLSIIPESIVKILNYEINDEKAKEIYESVINSNLIYMNVEYSQYTDENAVHYDTVFTAFATIN